MDLINELNVKKLLILLFSILLSFNSYGEEVGSESYDWKKWDCYDSIDDGYILSVGYIPEIGDSKGILFVKDVDSHIDTFHSLRGVQHFWEWDSYTIVIESNGTGGFYNNGISEERYECTSAPLEKLMSDIW